MHNPGDIPAGIRAQYLRVSSYNRTEMSHLFKPEEAFSIL